MARPHLSLGVERLEQLVAAADEVAALLLVAEELAHRKTNRALRLKRVVSERLRALQHQGALFVDPELEERPDTTITYFDEYRARGKHYRYGGTDDTYPEASKRVLDLKAGDQLAIFQTASRIGELVAEGATLAVVPSSDPANTRPGIARVASLVALLKSGTNACSALERTVKRKPARFGGDRSAEGHRATIAVDATLIANRNVLLIDDVTTSGTSLRTCRELLLEAGAHRVKMLAIAQTKR